MMLQMPVKLSEAHHFPQDVEVLRRGSRVGMLSYYILSPGLKYLLQVV